MGKKHICVPCASEAQYREYGDAPAQYRQSLSEMLSQYPALFPHGMDQGFTLHDASASVKQDLIMRRLTLITTGTVCTLRPSFVMPYLMARTDAVDKALYLRQWGGPFDALASVFGRDAMCWDRAWLACGRPSLVGPTGKEPQTWPRDLGAEETLPQVAKQQVDVPTTVGGDCCLGGSVVEAADTVTVERGYGECVLLTQLERMGVPSLFDEYFPTHGNWQGLSLGWVTAVWLTHMLSQADHRLNHVQPWVDKRLHTLRDCTGQDVQPLDVSDDRLAMVLHALSNDTRWDAFEGALNQQLLRVYDLSPERVRLDSTTASGYWAVTPEGLFQFGHSKDHRPDLPQVKVMLAALDPLGLPLATAVVPGQRADDPLYTPAITRVRESLGRRGLLYVGDCKMAGWRRALLPKQAETFTCVRCRNSRCRPTCWRGI